MAGRFLLHRSRQARARSRGEVDAHRAGIARLVALTTALADRMEQLPVPDLRTAQQRSARIAVLREAAEAGRRALAGRGRADGRQDAGSRDAGSRDAVG